MVLTDKINTCLRFLLISFFIFPGTCGKNKGLEQCYNNCYFNATIQFLSHIDGLEGDLLAQELLKDNNITNAYISLILQIKNKWSRSFNYLNLGHELVQSISLGEFYRCISDQISKRGCAQNDAQEGLTFLLNLINGNATTEQDAQTFRKFYLNISSSTTCSKCKNKTLNVESVLSTSLPTSGNNTLSECLDCFCREEILSEDNKHFCHKCTTQDKSTKCHKFSSLPDYLIFHLKRFEWTGTTTKNCHAIKFNQDLRFDGNSIWVTDELKQQLKNAPANYRLRSIIVHSGTAAFGHYWAYGCDKYDNWYRYDGQSVTTAGRDKNL